EYFYIMRIIVFYLWLVAAPLCFSVGAKIWHWQMGSFGVNEYAEGVESLFQIWEKEQGVAVAPAANRRVGLKVFSHSGPGLSTPVALVEAVRQALFRRGFRPEEVFLIDQRLFRLQQAGFLSWETPAERNFRGSPVISLQNDE